MSRLNFQLLKTASHSQARAAVLKTLHNEVQTPVFMPVGTHAAVRGQALSTLEALGFPVLLANTYHLLLRPGPEIFEKMGGIQKFMNWPRSVLTDSGGFQIFSLPNEREMTEEGAVFRSYVDTKKILLTPEKSIETQKSIQSDIMMVLDQCVCSTVDEKTARAAMELTHRWAKRSLLARGDSPQSLFGIVQGACYPDLRKESADYLTGLPFDGFAIGGLAVGETKDLREEMTERTTALLPKKLPRYLMGVGTPLDLLEAVHRGVDMFDCILPTALGQQGVAFTSRGRVDLRRGTYKLLDASLDSECPCPACTSHSLAYLHHLIRIGEHTGRNLIATHNLFFYKKLMDGMRESILNDTFLQYYREQKERLSQTDRSFPITPPKSGKKKGPAPVLGAFSLHEVTETVFSIKHDPSGEVMHSVNDPNEEARRLYIEQSNLHEELQKETDEPLVIWDIGLGAAINAMAVVFCHQKLWDAKDGKVRPLHLVSFERDLDALRLAVKHHKRFPHLRHGAPKKLLDEKTWRHSGGTFTWTLFEGDFLTWIEKAPKPHKIFFDPFSGKTDTEAWTDSAFCKLYELCKDAHTELFTYSSSTEVRALLLAQGFYVAKGAGTGPKSDTTIALSPRAAKQTPFSLLKDDWLFRWERSHVKFPRSIPPESHTKFAKTIQSHPQFIS